MSNPPFPPNIHFGWDTGMSSVMMNVHNFFFAGGTTLNNFVMRDPSDNEPIGYVHFHQTGAGDLTISGFILPYPIGAHVPLLFIKNDGPNNVVMLEESNLSAPENRFNFGGAGNQTLTPTLIGAGLLLIYDPDLTRWQPGP